MNICLRDCGCYCFSLLLVTVLAEPLRGEDTVGTLNDSRKLLKLLPKSTESVLCVDATSELSRRDDLTKVSVFETAVYFTNFLSVKHSAKLDLADRRIKCAVNAVRAIRAPKSRVATNIRSGPFEAQRCELLLLTEALPTDWLDRTTSISNGKLSRAANRPLVEFLFEGETVFLSQLAKDLLCVANHREFLDEILQLASEAGNGPAKPIEDDPTFHAAMSHIAKSSKFWGVRLYNRTQDIKDITSVRNPSPVAGIHDPTAGFVAVELTNIDSQILQLFYASEDEAMATKRFPAFMGKIVQKLNAVFTAKAGARNYFISSMTCDLSAGDDDAAVMFLGVCAMFGQGLLL